MKFGDWGLYEVRGEEVRIWILFGGRRSCPPALLKFLIPDSYRPAVVEAGAGSRLIVSPVNIISSKV
jgi:hypothetical protein